MNHEVFAALGEALKNGEDVALVTIVSANGSTPQRVGAKMLVFADGRVVGTIGGGCYENEALWKAREALKTRKASTEHYELADDFAAVDAVFASTFAREPPARIAVGVAALPAGARVAVDAIVPIRTAGAPAR